MVALRGMVLFPKMVLHFDIGRDKSVEALNQAMTQDRKIFLAAQKELLAENPTWDGLYKVGVVGRIKQVLKAKGNLLRVVVEGVYRAKVVNVVKEAPFYQVNCMEYPLFEQRVSKKDYREALLRTTKDLFEEYCNHASQMPNDMVVNTMLAEDAQYLGEYIAQNLPFSLEDKQRILEESNVETRLEIVAKLLQKENNILKLEQEIASKVREQMDKNHRDYYLREQLRAINAELGEDNQAQEELEKYQSKLDALTLEEDTRKRLQEELDKFSRLSYNSQEAMVSRNYLDLVLGLPWNTSTKDKLDVNQAARVLDKDHYGMKKVKERILEALSVYKMAPDMKGQIICLVGPPGVGKTSIAKSIAKAMGKKYVRMSLGGIRDEADIRGHRKTYIGAMPGRIISALKQAGTNNPLLLLDEVDKLGSDYKGDPSSALLEVLDAEQNFSFRDHYVEVPFDLSKVMFLATANDASAIPGPLYDRMEVIDLSSYTREEKFHIAKEHLVPKQVKRHGLNGRMVRFEEEALYAVIDGYTREAGVRTLERTLASVCCKCAKEIVAGEKKSCKINAATVETLLGPRKFKEDSLEKKDLIGVVNGLAWTSVGGEILQVEVAVVEGTGKIELTGSLGDVMKESAKAAVTYVRSCCQKYSIDPDFYKTKDIHIHFPEGAVPKDGPSAGVTITTALVSALANVPVRGDVAMTGEVTLRGRVLAIGGLREKTMAAYRYGIKTVLIPKENEPDLHEIDPVVKENIRFVPAEEVSTVLDTALVYAISFEKEETELVELSLLGASQKGKRPETVLRQ